MKCVHKNEVITILKEYTIITIGVILTVLGTYFFRFPNNFTFGGVTGLCVMIAEKTSLSAGQTNAIINAFLLVLGFITLGKGFGVKTIYATILISLGLSLLDVLYPMATPITNEPLLELLYAVALPGVASGLLFSVGASGGGTDIVAMIIKKHSNINIGTALLVADSVITFGALWVFGIQTFLFSVAGLLTKSLVVDNIIEGMNLCKVFNVICKKPEKVCDYITHTLHRGATISEAQGAFSHEKQYIVMSVMKPSQGYMLQQYLKKVEPDAFITITNTSEIIGKGFKPS